MKKAIGYIATAWALFFSSFFTHPLFAQGFVVTYCDAGQTQIQTAIGCLDTSPAGFTKKLLGLSLGK